MAGYVFLSNSTKPTAEKAKNRELIVPGNVSAPCIKAAMSHEYEVYLGVNRENPEELECSMPVHLYDQHTYRSITAFGDNKIAYNNLCKVIKEGDIEVIHCNTPVGGMVGRFAGKKHGVKKIIYTAHGFHFYKGAPLFNRTVLKWAEQIMAHWTDAIITMNREDFEAAKKFRLRNSGKVYLVHGVGITLSDFEGKSEFRGQKREELGLADGDVALISAGDLILRKDYATAIRAIALANNPKLHYFICGRGPEKENLEALSRELGVENQIHFLGFRGDVKELMAASDIFLFTTLQEGMPRSMMEAMASGLPCVASAIRGNVDLIENGENGYICAPKDAEGFSKAIVSLCENKELRDEISRKNLEKIKEYDISVVEKEIKAIYDEVLGK